MPCAFFAVCGEARRITRLSPECKRLGGRPYCIGNRPAARAHLSRPPGPHPRSAGARGLAEFHWTVAPRDLRIPVDVSLRIALRFLAICSARRLTCAALRRYGGEQPAIFRRATFAEMSTRPVRHLPFLSYTNLFGDTRIAISASFL